MSRDSKTKTAEMEQHGGTGLQQICISKSGPGKTVEARNADPSLRGKEKLLLESNLLDQYSEKSWPKQVHRAVCPQPILWHSPHEKQVQVLHEALVLVITNIAERWRVDDEARFPERMPLEPYEEELLRVITPSNRMSGSISC